MLRRMHDERRLALLNADHRRLVRAAARLLGPAEAEDAVQDAYVRALEATQAHALNAAQAWLLTVVRNLAVDRLRRRQWMQQWLVDTTAGDTALTSPSAESDAALAEDAAHALRLIAAYLSLADGAALLLHEVFDASHAEIAQASGRSEAGSRQQLRRALLRLRQAVDTKPREPGAEPDTTEDMAFRLYLQALQRRDPHALWAMLRHPPISASATARTTHTVAASESASVPPLTTSVVTQMGGQLGLVLTLDGVTLCVVPLGVLTNRAEHAQDTALR